MLKNTIALVFDCQPEVFTYTKQPSLRDMIFKYYLDKTYDLVQARDLTDAYINKISKKFEE